MTSAAGAGGGVGSGSGGGAYFVVTLLFVFGFSLEDSAEAGDEWTHCPFFFWSVGVGWGEEKEEEEEVVFFFPFLPPLIMVLGWKRLCDPDVGSPPPEEGEESWMREKDRYGK